MKMRVGFIFIQMFCHVFMLRKMFGEMLPRFANRFFSGGKEPPARGIYLPSYINGCFWFP